MKRNLLRRLTRPVRSPVARWVMRRDTEPALRSSPEARIVAMDG